MDPFVDALEAPGVERRVMFGRDALLVDRHVYAFLDGERLALRLPPADAAELLATGDGRTPIMGKRSMDGWVSVPLEGDRTPLITAAREHVRAHYAP
ncbi:TfoX/Sxy family protein [Actinomycetospora sp. OC33-EN08]|uniref:TfoX/Sxy family protein n=1 Tax=Actinomycetospora aurantiaca TaxID=3129233 RepID=A0ABU8MVS6_9PSEU